MKYTIELTDEVVKSLHSAASFAEPSSLLKIIANQIPKPMLDGVYMFTDFQNDRALAYVKNGMFSDYLMPDGHLMDPEPVSGSRNTNWTRLADLPDMV